MTLKQRFDFCIRWFAEHMPTAESELHYGNSYELLVAVMLSAQCTDKRVNMVTPALFAAYPTAEALSQATVEEVLHYVHSVSYPNSKATHLREMAKKLVSDFGGEVPQTVDQLVTLPGVGRKTANVICAVIWQQPTFAVDTHIFRVSERIGLTTNSKSPLETERVLTKHFPPEIIPLAHHWLLLHGRYVCVARKPKCRECGLQEACREYQKKK